MKYEAVFFDAGDTLLAPHPSFHEIFSRTLREMGHDVTPAQAEAALQSVAPNFIEILETIGEDSWSTSREVSQRFWGSVYAAAFQVLSIDDSAGNLATTLYDVFTRYESYKLFPDAVPAIEAVRQAGMKVGLISNFEEWLEGMLSHWEVDHLFDVMVISGKEGIEKPDPRIFQIALERAGARAERSVYVGDHPQIDAAASASIGMTGVLIDRRGRNPDHDGPRIITLDELLPIVGIEDGRA